MGFATCHIATCWGLLVHFSSFFFQPDISYLPIYPSTHPSIHLSAYLSVCLPIYLCIHRPIHPFICLSITYLNHLTVCALCHVQLFAVPWTVACQTPLSKEFPRQQYWSGLPFLPSGDLPNSGIEPRSPALQANDLPLSRLGSPYHLYSYIIFQEISIQVATRFYICLSSKILIIKMAYINSAKQI